MIYSYKVYETLLDISRKDLRGRSLSVEEFNNVAPIVNQLVFEKYYKEFESTLENSESLSVFKVLDEAVPLVAGVGTLPARYYHSVGMPWYTDTGGVRRYVDFVSSMEHAKREQDYLTKASFTFPTYRLGKVSTTVAMTVHVTPTTITPINLDYIRTPDVPILDYYVNDTTLVYSWMLSGGVVTAVPAGSMAMNGTAGAANVVSTTVDWEWNSEDMPLIINLFIQYLGLQLPDQILIEGGLALEQKSDQK